MDANVQGLMGSVYLCYLFLCGNSGGLLWPSINSRMPSWSSPPPFCSRSATAACTEITPIPASQRKPAPKPIPNGNSAIVRESIDEKDIIKMATDKLRRDELKAREHVSDKDERAFKNFAKILSSSVRDGIKSLTKSNSSS